MAFTSKLYPGEKIIHDTSPADWEVTPAGMSKGLELARRGPEGYAGVAEPFPDDLLIPMSEMEARIKEAEETKTRLSDIVDQAGLPCKDQNGTNYCWINAPTHCVEIVRCWQNQEMVILSPASAGGPIKGFRNEGGWGKEGLEFIIKNGLVPVDKWPANAIQRSYYTEENKQIALNYRVTEWTECRPRNIQQVASLLLRKIPGASGLNWWSHEVTYYEPVWIDGTLAIRIRNSWGMQWGTKGYSILQGSKMLPDDYVCPRVAVAA